MTVEARIRRWSNIISKLGLEIAEVHQGGKHLKFRLTCGHAVVMSKTPSDWRCDRNALSRLRRLVDLPPKKPKESRQPSGEVAVAQAPRPPSGSGWKPGMGHSRERILSEAVRLRLGLDGRRVPEAHPLPKLDRPVLTLRR